ncbi:Peptidase M48 [Babesia duncani]|uniref:Peptidase M48 n=1 Tax=Babesia duncani TaxID=323732 RepID=A0AAD9PNY1_9APIC|nr:Peptidase M48 [Babesia duncani]
MNLQVGVLMHILSTSLTRKNEYQADEFSVKLGYGSDLAQALVELGQQNKSLIHHDALYSWFHFTHPVLYERLHAIYAAMANQKLA